MLLAERLIPLWIMGCYIPSVPLAFSKGGRISIVLIFFRLITGALNGRSIAFAIHSLDRSLDRSSHPTNFSFVQSRGKENDDVNRKSVVD